MPLNHETESVDTTSVKTAAPLYSNVPMPHQQRCDFRSPLQCDGNSTGNESNYGGPHVSYCGLEAGYRGASLHRSADAEEHAVNGKSQPRGGGGGVSDNGSTGQGGRWLTSHGTRPRAPREQSLCRRGHTVGAAAGSHCRHHRV